MLALEVMDPGLLLLSDTRKCERLPGEEDLDEADEDEALESGMGSEDEDGTYDCTDITGIGEAAAPSFDMDPDSAAASSLLDPPCTRPSPKRSNTKAS